MWTPILTLLTQGFMMTTSTIMIVFLPITMMHTSLLTMTRIPGIIMKMILSFTTITLTCMTTTIIKCTYKQMIKLTMTFSPSQMLNKKRLAYSTASLIGSE